MYTVEDPMEEHEDKDKIGHCKKPKTGGGPAETEFNTVSTAVSTMLPQHINRIGYEFDDDAALHGNIKKIPL